MAIQALFPDGPTFTMEGERQYVSVPWNEAGALHSTLRKSGCPTTLCLNPETRTARLELWPGVNPEAVLAVLEVRYPRRQLTSQATATPSTVQRNTMPVSTTADAISV